MSDRPIVMLGELRSKQTRATALRGIAGLLRSGNADQYFLDLLANSIDPDIEQPIAGVRLVPQNTRKGAPKSFNLPLAQFLYQKSECDEYLDAAVAEAVVKFKVSERTCWNALAELKHQYSLINDYQSLTKMYGAENK